MNWCCLIHVCVFVVARESVNILVFRSKCCTYVKWMLCVPVLGSVGHLDVFDVFERPLHEAVDIHCK